MTDLAAWQAGNASYLAAAIAWLRLRLQHASADTTVTEEETAKAEAKLLDVEAMKPAPAAIALSSIFGLTRFELSLLLLCAAMELDTEIASLCAKVQGDSQPYPTFALAFGLFHNPAWDVVSPERPLRSWRLIEIHQSGVQPLTVSPLKVDERIVNYLKGLNYLDDRLNSLLAPLPIPESEESSYRSLAASQQQVVEAIAHPLQTVTHRRSLPMIQLLGSDRASKQGVALSVADRFDIPLYRMRVELLPSQASELETLVCLWQREVQLFPAALYLDGQVMEGGNSANNPAAALHYFLDSTQGLFFLDVREQSGLLERSTLSFEVAKPKPDEQLYAWKQVLGRTKEEGGALLASQFNLTLADIREIAATTEAEMGLAPDRKTAKQPSKSQGELLRDRLWAACLVRTRPRLDALAQRLDTKATWNDIVLPEAETSLLRQIAAQVRHRSRVYDDWGFRDRMNRGLGVNALFAGESGTGKTMAAEVIANELRLNLYRIDLSAVVSKYIGETEKNLRRLFDAAEDGGAILFFDEADALFGKRSEVKDSHDRYANIEVNYLLQRIEAYRGLAILATNLKKSMDSAFLRRLRFVIDFPFPSLESRQQMWQKVFPPQTPVDVLAYDRLGRMNLTGGSIHNIAINAAFLAAQENASVGMPHILTAARAEFRKLDLPIYEGDFRWEAPVLLELER
ncbi:ATP-binding protein [Synechococcus sp. PCC 7336]|uniref:ATP-binding protein n=1 Tax=Synechococcus sp. PCC 7336 TaxID=195250 RepID=UPI000347F73C|nr:AAA family ATPase [Synechococcus sp. PCC 7336]